MHFLKHCNIFSCTYIIYTRVYWHLKCSNMLTVVLIRYRTTFAQTLPKSRHSQEWCLLIVQLSVLTRIKLGWHVFSVHGHCHLLYLKRVFSTMHPSQTTITTTHKINTSLFLNGYQERLMISLDNITSAGVQSSHNKKVILLCKHTKLGRQGLITCQLPHINTAQKLPCHGTVNSKKHLHLCYECIESDTLGEQQLKHVCKF